MFENSFFVISMNCSLEFMDSKVDPVVVFLFPKPELLLAFFQQLVKCGCFPTKEQEHNSKFFEETIESYEPFEKKTLQLEDIVPVEEVEEEEEEEKKSEKKLEWLFNKQSDLEEEILEGLELHQPEPCDEGVNGSYFVKNKEGKKIAIFKPQDEEVETQENPKDSGATLPEGLKAGESCFREVAAQIIDSEGFSQVPPTSLINLCINGSKKMGSLQKFVDSEGSSEDMGSSAFPVKEVHKIGVLDLQILNVDRHAGNILVTREEDGTFGLVPIDNGFSLPDTVNNTLWFEWMNWKQAKEPFDAETLHYIEQIDIEKNVQKLQHLNIRPECLDMMRISTYLLKEGAKQGLTLYEIASFLCRLNPATPSTIETICSQAKNQTTSTQEFVSCVIHLINQELKNKNKTA